MEEHELGLPKGFEQELCCYKQFSSTAVMATGSTEVIRIPGCCRLFYQLGRLTLDIA